MIWHSNSLENVVNELNTNIDKGLTVDEAVRRSQHISAKIHKKTKKATPFKCFFNELKGTSYALLLAAAALALIFNLIFGTLSLFEPIALLVAAVAKAAVVAFINTASEKRTDTIEFEKRVAVTVMRDGEKKVISAANAVPGDIIFVTEGDYVHVDARLINESNLHCDEYALTGDTVPTQKNADDTPADIAPINERGNMLFAGSHILSGSGTAIVTEVLDYTELSKKKVVNDTIDGALNIETRLLQLEKLISTTTAGGYALLFMLSLIFGTVKGIYAINGFLNVLCASLLLISALSVAFKMTTVKLLTKASVAAGLKNMRSKGIIINNVETVDKIARLDVVCADKTGTLTQNRQLLSVLYNGINETDVANDTIDGDCKMLLRFAALCCDGDVKLVNGVSVQSGDPTQTAIIAASLEHLGLGKYELDNIYPRMATIPFDPNRKLMTTVNVIDGQKYVIVRGAVEQLLPCCDGDNNRYVAETEKLSAQNLRVVGVAIKQIEEYSAEPTPEELETGLHIMGLLGLSDVIRHDSEKAVTDCKNAGMKVVMLTGDRKSAALATALKLGIAESENQVLDSVQLDSLTDDELCEKIELYTVFSQLDAAHRIRIVKALQDAGHYVAVTVDDNANTSAQRIANVAYSMGKSGTDSAISESEVIIEDDSFSSVAKSVRYCRGIYHNIAKSLKFFFSSALGAFLATVVGVILFGTSVCTDIEYVILAIIVCIPIAVGIACQHAESDDLQLIIDNDSGIFESKFLLDIVFYAVVYCLAATVAYCFGLAFENTSPTGLTFTVMAISTILCGILHRTDNIRDLTKRNNPIFAAAAISGAVLLLIFGIIGIGRFTALGITAWLTSLAISLVTAALCLAVKLIRK